MRLGRDCVASGSSSGGCQPIESSKLLVPCPRSPYYVPMSLDTLYYLRAESASKVARLHTAKEEVVTYVPMGDPVPHLVNAIVHFLAGESCCSQHLPPRAKSHLNLAITCLQNAYGMPIVPPHLLHHHYTAVRPLMDIYMESMKPQYVPPHVVQPQQPTLTYLGGLPPPEAHLLPSPTTPGPPHPAVPLSPASSPEQPLELTVRQPPSPSSSSSSRSSSPGSIPAEPPLPLDLSSSMSQHHLLVRFPPKGGCVQCGREGRLTKRGRPHESYFGCRACRVHLCRKRNCFELWHTHPY